MTNLLTPTQAATWFADHGAHVSARAIRKAIADNAFPGALVGTRYLISEAALEQRFLPALMQDEREPTPIRGNRFMGKKAS